MHSAGPYRGPSIAAQMALRFANAPTSWGVEDARDTANPSWSQVLDEVAEAGYEGVELGPPGFLPEDEAVLREALERRRLRLVAGYVFEPLHEATPIEVASRTCRAVAAAGARLLVVIQGFTRAREQAAGRPREAPPLNEPEWERLVASVEEIARRARDEHGLTACFHPHAGTHVEFADEIHRLVEQTDPELVSLCIDTGHCVYAGIDPVDLYRRYSERVAYLHLKDVDPTALEAALVGRMGFEQAVGRGVFCPLGEGIVDFEGLAAALSEHGYRGWATVEQDRLAGARRSPLADARASLERLRTLGLAGVAG